MSAKALREFLLAASRDSRLRSDDRRGLKALAKAFTATDLGAIAPRLNISGAREAREPSAELVRLVETLGRCEAALGNSLTRSLRTELRLVSTAAKASRASSVLQFVESLRLALRPSKSSKRTRGKPLNTDLVAHHVSRLTEALRDPEKFSNAVVELEADRGVRSVELVAIVKEFYGAVPPGSSREDCFALIRMRHRALMKSRAKGRAQSGKSAA